MKAIYHSEFGPPEVLRLIEIDKPEPKANESLIKIHATGVNFGDLAARNFKNLTSKDFHMPGFLRFPARFMFGLNKPNKPILGNEYSGEVVAVGKDVKMFKMGDPVMGYQAEKMGAYAEYLCVPEDGMVVRKPENISSDEAATIQGGAVTAMILLRKIEEKNGLSASGKNPGKYKVLVNGASGGIGAGGMQILKKHYMAEVTAVCSTDRIDFVKKLGADKVIDYTQEDYTLGNEKYDLVFDILGKSTFSDCKKVLKENGIFLLASFKGKKIIQMLWTKFFSRKKVICAMAFCKPDDLLSVKKLIEQDVLKSIIDKRFPLEKAVEAHRYMEEGKRKGNVVLTINR